MGTHIVKTTIEIADALFAQAQRAAQEEGTTLRALTEQGLRLVLKQKQAKARKWSWRPVVVRGKGRSGEFARGWTSIRDEIYRGRGT